MTVTTPPPAAPAARAPLYHYDGNGPRRGRRIAVLNNKGGVGKTGLCVGLAAALARLGRRVLVADMDPQANATRRLAANPADATLTAVLATYQRGSATDAVVPCGWNAPEAAHIDVIPADAGLTFRDAEAAQPGAGNRLRRILHGLTDAYDYTLVDCRPTLGHLEQMVVQALDGPDDGFLVPVEPGADAIGGAVRVIRQVHWWADAMEVTAPPLGVIINLYDGRTRLHRGSAATLAASLATLDSDEPDAPPEIPRIFNTRIPRNIHLGGVFHLALPVTAADPRLSAEGIIECFDLLAQGVDQ